MGGAWLDRLKGWATGLKRDVVALRFAAHDRRTPWYAKVVAAAVAAYALSDLDQPAGAPLREAALTPSGEVQPKQCVNISICARLAPRETGCWWARQDSNFTR